MQPQLVTINRELVLNGYKALALLYPAIPSLILWRGWEFAAYQRYTLPEPVLDIGCGDGRFFHLLWPNIHDATGIDHNPNAIELARQSGFYKTVVQSTADKMPAQSNQFASAFANCSLEHMDNLPDVLANISSNLRPGSPFLLSVVTNKFLEWASLPSLIALTVNPEQAKSLRGEFESYHHLVTVVALSEWIVELNKAGFAVLEHTPILPEMTSRLFLFIDHLWHHPQEEGEFGDRLYCYLKSHSGFHEGFLKVLEGILTMEEDLTLGSGIVLWTRKRSE